MTSPRYDSVLIGIDWISFRYFFRRQFRAYLVVVSADTNGTIGIYESPEVYSVLHRPMRDKPATIDFGFDGFVIYSSAGVVPDLVRFDVFVVKDKSEGRRVGALMEMIRGSQQLEATVASARSAMASASADGSVAASVATAVTPVLDLVGGLVENMDNEVIEAYSGSKIFDGPMVSKAEGELRKKIHQAVISPTGNIQTKVDITLFQRQDGVVHEVTEGIPLVRIPPETAVPDVAQPEVVRPEIVRPPEVTTPEADEPTLDVAADPNNVAISLRRPRVLFHVGWVAAALVPLGILLGAASSDSAPAFGRVTLIMALFSIIFSPALLYGAGQWARARLGKKGLTRLGWFAVIFHVFSLIFVGLGAWVLIDALTDETTTGWDSVGQLIGALLGTVAMVAISLVPWLVSAITALVFGRRATRKVSGVG